MSPGKARPDRGKGKAKPPNFTADRLDSVLKGQLVQLDVPSLAGATPAEGWFEVAGVAVVAGVVTLTFVGSVEAFAAPGDRLVHVGWV